MNAIVEVSMNLQHNLYPSEKEVKKGCKVQTDCQADK